MGGETGNTREHSIALRLLLLCSQHRACARREHFIATYRFTPHRTGQCLWRLLPLVKCSLLMNKLRVSLRLSKGASVERFNMTSQPNPPHHTRHRDQKHFSRATTALRLVRELSTSSLSPPRAHSSLMTYSSPSLAMLYYLPPQQSSCDFRNSDWRWCT